MSTGLLDLAPARPAATGAADPQMPESTIWNSAAGPNANTDAATTEIHSQEDGEQAGAVDSGIALLSEQRAMQVVHRFQTLSILALKEPEELTEAQPEALPPNAPPTSLLAMLPQEWPLARLSVQLRHVGVLLRVTLYRRLAELSFRGAPFNQLPREVAREVRRDFDVICGATARQLASLFEFLRPEQTVPKRARPKRWKQEVSRHFVQEMKMQLRRWSPTAMLFRSCEQW